MTGPDEKIRDGASNRSEKETAPRLPLRVERRVRAARLLLLIEALMPALWPATAFAGLYVALALFGFFSRITPGVHWVLLAASGATFVWLLWRGFRGFAFPTRAEALRHLERSSGLSHSPLSAYEDVPAPATGDMGLWIAHRNWIAERMAKIRLGLPPSILAARDPFALRAIVALLLVVAIAGTGPGHLNRLTDALFPGASGARAANIEAWVTPPAYTGKAPVYLKQADDRPASAETLTVPAGSILAIRVHGLKNAPVLDRRDDERERPEELRTISEGNHAIDAKLMESGDVALTEGGRMIRMWRFDVTPDAPPSIEVTAPVAQSASGALRLSYRVADDFGVASAEARIALDRSGVEATEENSVVPQPRVTAPDVPLTLPAHRPREAEGETYAELTAHPWAGLPVTITLVAKDDIEQEGMSEPLSLVLPEREFTKPLARAIVEQRRRLALDPRSSASVARFIDNFTQDAERYIEDKVVYLALRAAYWRLSEATRDTDLTGIYDLLWSVALRIEDGDLSLAERDLRDARERLAEALSQGAGDEEIARLMQELRDAFNRYMEAMSEKAQTSNPQLSGDFGSDMQTIDRDELQAMLDAISELAQSGARDQARAMLERLQNILENLQLPSENAGLTPGEQAMSNAVEQMGDLIAKQQELMDRTFRKLQEMERRAGEVPPGLPQPGNAHPDLGELGAKQEALREELSKIMRELEEAGAETPGALGEAEDAMGAATERLGAGRADRAAGAQGQAIERMQQGAQALADKLMEGRAGRSGAQGRGQTDPFGRPLSESGSAQGDDVSIPDQMDMQRARQILEELRERARDLGRPQLELDYLERLLRRF